MGARAAAKGITGLGVNTIFLLLTLAGWKRSKDPKPKTEECLPRTEPEPIEPRVEPEPVAPEPIQPEPINPESCPQPGGTQTAPSAAGELGLKDIIKQASGWSPGKAGEYFGWVGRGVTKNAKDFTKADLLEKGFTKDALEKMAQAYECIAKMSSATGNVNPSAASRAAQLREILKELF